MAENEVSEVLQALKGQLKEKDPKELPVEALSLLLTADRLHKLEHDSRKELKELRERQHKVSFLHKLIRTVNAGTDEKGHFDGSTHAELRDFLKQAKEIGVELDESKLIYKNEERERLLDNIRLSVEDLNMMNELQLQTVTRMTSERYESYQMARSILRPLHEDKLNKARAISGR